MNALSAKKKESCSHYTSNSSMLSKDHLLSCGLMKCSEVTVYLTLLDTWKTKYWKGMFTKRGSRRTLQCCWLWRALLQERQNCWCRQQLRKDASESTHAQLSKPEICLFRY